jgi:phosphoserine aminotransferase
MQKTFFTVGPSQMYPTVSQHIRKAFRDDIPSISHRTQQFSKIYQQTAISLKQLLNVPDDHHIFFLGSATEAMERIIQNTVEKNSFHFVNGVFSKKFFTIAQQLQKNPQIFETNLDQGIDILSVPIPSDTELITLTQNETSGGTQIPVKDIKKLKNNHPNILLAIDIVSSTPYVQIDFTIADMVFFSIQKGFGLPAGLGVLIVNNQSLEKARRLSEKNISTGSFHNFHTLAEKEKKFQTFETPNVLLIYLLGKVCEDMLARGIENIRKETDEKAKLIYDYFDQHAQYKPLIKEINFRSKTTIVIDTNGQTQNILPLLAEQGYILSSGYGKQKDQQIRIANFPSLSLIQTKNLLSQFNHLSI